ncbi:hypothetical protein HYH02_009388 [Chlamydomonas schloesseri]|uniref:Uncharacterized protein n=1 Tax=Chlamydomonas schloesseri TaxID=2026947 RepID=A0A835W7E5_9CHLO|nr:hypothetical protein HYH02_009388 [Chlamydomonas schloesseri]|eukprot:KAG2443322.1 hypothetical protein HYH02_009388 [Chlamydomonas schloesseri]
MSLNVPLALLVAKLTTGASGMQAMAHMSTHADKVRESAPGRAWLVWLDMLLNAVMEGVLAVLWARVLPSYAAAVDGSTLPMASMRMTCYHLAVALYVLLLLSLSFRTVEVVRALMSGACGRGRGGPGTAGGLSGAGAGKPEPSPGRRQVPLSDAHAWRYTQCAGGVDGGVGEASSNGSGLPRAFISTGARAPATEHTPLRMGPCSDEV